MICLVLALVFGVIVYRVIIITILSQSDSTRRYSGLLIYLKKILLGHLISFEKIVNRIRYFGRPNIKRMR